MKKQILNIIIFLFLLGCSDNTSDCFSSSGKEVSKSLNLSDFSKVIIHEGISLELKQGIENSLQITYGENLIDNISTTITDGTLSIKNSSCNIFRDTKPAKIVLTAIDITEIRNASQFSVVSNEVLKFNFLTLLSEDFFLPSVNVGNFDLHIENTYIRIISNNVSNFTIKGKTHSLFVGFYAGEGKFNGEFLKAQYIDIFHRGINKIIINPVQKLTGEIRGTGNLISVNRPPIVNVKEYYTGKLIFK